MINILHNKHQNDNVIHINAILNKNELNLFVIAAVMAANNTDNVIQKMHNKNCTCKLRPLLIIKAEFQ